MTYRRHRPFPKLQLAVAFALVGLAAHAVAEPVAIEAIRDAGVERLRMTWASPVTFTAGAADGLLTLTFDRPIDADLRAASTLTRVAGPARLSDDRRSLLLPLVPQASALSYADDRFVFIDLLATMPTATRPPASTPPPPATPAATGIARPPADAPDAPAPSGDRNAPPAAVVAPVRIRFGEHAGFSRVVFDWPVDVGYRIERSQGTATVIFDRIGRLDASKAGRRPSRLRDLRVIPADADVAVQLTMANADATVRDFRLGTRVVIDIAAADANGSFGASAAGPLAAPPAATAAASAGTAAVEGSTAASPMPHATVLPPPLPVARPDPTAVQPTPPEPVPTAAADAPLEPGDEAPATAAVAKAISPLEFGAVHPQQLPAQLRFDWQHPVAAAVFRRTGRLWIVFDAASQTDCAALTAASNGVVTAMRQLPVDGATVLVADMATGAEPRLLRSGHAWIIAFDQAAATTVPPEALVPMPEPQAAGGPRLVVPVAAPGRSIVVGDPEIGDTLIVVPTIPLGRGLNRHHRYPMFELLPTRQGIVVAPLIDSLRVDSGRDEVIVSRLAGLSLSPLPESIRAGTRLAPPADIRPTIDLHRWADLRPADFIAQRQALTREAGLASGSTRITTRLALAEFYLAHGLASEAFGETEMIASIDKQAAAQPPVRLIAGAARLLQGRIAEAQRTLNDPILDSLDEAALWRAAADAAATAPPTATQPFARHGALLMGYPRALRLPLSQLLIELAIAAGQFQPAQHLLAAARADSPAAGDSALLDVLEARMRLAAGDRSGARESFARAAAGPPAKAQALAEAELVELELADGMIDAAQAFERLDGLRFMWRGDSFEARLLLRLSELANDLGDPAGALRTLRRVTSHFRGRPEASAATDRMATLFQSLYLDGAADRLAPVAAVALYNEFRELTPSGEAGKRVVLGLAERLMAMELPGTAATVLEPALLAATETARRAEFGTALARANDQAGKPQAVLAALESSHADTLPDTLLSVRRRLQAKALIDLGRHDDAVAIVAQLNGQDATKLRTEIYRRRGDWAAVSRLLAEQLAADGHADIGSGERRLGRSGAREFAETARPRDGNAARAAPSSALERPAAQILGSEGLGHAPDRAAIDRVVDEAVRFRDALKAAPFSP